jgi:branched-chain amino acid transport system ATP-binding protein
MLPLLRLDGISKSFGALQVIDRLSVDVRKGEALGIIGPNGAGKSTMFNLVTGDLRPSSGRVVFSGNDVTAEPVHVRCRRGIGRSYQIPHPFSGMTVFENLLVAAVFGTGRREAACYADCIEVLARTGLIEKANLAAGGLSLLERKRLELARALATRPMLLLLDEIAGGLTDSECESLIETIGGIHADGVSIVWIEHVVHALLAVVDRLIVIDFGRQIAEGAPKAVMASPAVQEIYLGVEAT